MRVHHLNCGTMRPVGARFLLGSPSELGHCMICHCLVIETDAHGLVLVDTGIGMGDIENPKGFGPLAWIGRPSFDPQESLVYQLAALGHRAEDVQHIVLTHMDLDHTSGMPDFPNAEVHVHADELVAATERSTLHERNRYVPRHWAHEPTFHSYAADGERWLGFECVRDLKGLPPEILLVPLPGHSRGHTAVAVQTDEGWLLHCGDAYFHHKEGRPGAGRAPVGLRLFQRAVQVDGRQRVANQVRLRELAAGHGDEVDLFCAHDPTEWLARSIHEASSETKEAQC